MGGGGGLVGVEWPGRENYTGRMRNWVGAVCLLFSAFLDFSSIWMLSSIWKGASVDRPRLGCSFAFQRARLGCTAPRVSLISALSQRQSEDSEEVRLMDGGEKAGIPGIPGIPGIVGIIAV